MPEMNLAQRTDRNNVGWRRWFGKGALFLVVVSVAAIALWQGLLFYERVLADRIAAKDIEISDAIASISQEDINKIADFQFRLDGVSTGLARQASVGNPAELLGTVEKVVVPGVRLVSYSYDAGTGTIGIDGEADSFRSVVQQMVAFKSEPGYETLSVSDIGRNESNRVTFSFSVAFSRPQK